MAINNGCVPFTSSLISRAPETSGVFALWQSGGIVYYGTASSGSATIRQALDGQFRARSLSERRVSGCSWEVAPDPQARLRELMREYELAHRCMPLWNDPQRLPTD
jgi:hypothetical protein